MLKSVQYFLQKQSSIAPLISFRVLFGLLMFFALCRNWYLGYVEKFFIRPNFCFKFYGFEWIQPLGAELTYFLYGLLCLSSLGILFGIFYRWASLIFFILFSYFELMDVTHYLNHYYFVMLMSLLLCWLPAGRNYSIDAWLRPQQKLSTIPHWMIFLLQMQLAIVYFYAGIAKLHPDWLIEAQPLRIWLARQSDFPVIGSVLTLPFTAYVFAWFGALYDLSIPLWLWWKKSRPWAYTTVVIFHLATAMFFNIGVFPYVMIAFTLIFFSEFWHQKLFTTFALVFILTLSKLKYQPKQTKPTTLSGSSLEAKVPFLCWLYIAFQLLFPLRHWLYKGNVLWTEEGFRFAWKVMVVEKTGSAIFTVRDAIDGKETQVNNADYLSDKQEVMMSYQPDLILQFAHHLAREFRQKGYKEPIVTVDCFVSLNGRPSRRFIDPKVNLTNEKNSLGHKPWILLYNDL